MRNTRWLRYGLASIIAAGAGLGATLVACGDDDAASSSSATSRHGHARHEPRRHGHGRGRRGRRQADLREDHDRQRDDGHGRGVDAQRSRRRGLSHLLQDRHDRGQPQRRSVSPLPDKPKGGAPIPGIFYGTGGTFPSFGLDLEPRIIVPIIMNARTLAEKATSTRATVSPARRATRSSARSQTLRSA